MVSVSPTSMANNHIPLKAGKDHYPQVIAVSTTASLHLIKCLQFSSMINTVVPLCVQAMGGQLPLHLGSGSVRAILDAEGKTQPEILQHCYTVIYHNPKRSVCVQGCNI